MPTHRSNVLLWRPAGSLNKVGSTSYGHWAYAMLRHRASKMFTTGVGGASIGVKLTEPQV